jgi:GNAT superfamily N-acetyltransferase
LVANGPTAGLEIALLTGDKGARLGPKAAEVLASAFANYPFLARAFEGSQLPRDQMLRKMFGIAIDYRLALDIPAFVAVEKGRVVGAATVSIPDSPELPLEFQAQWEDLGKHVAPEGRALFEAYEELQGECKPSEPHLYLVAVGVLREAQGLGVGRALISAVQGLASRMPGVCGVALDTHDSGNVSKYQRMGFRLIAERDLLGMPTWFFWDQP